MAKFAANTPLIGLDVVVMDTETTGLDPKTARLVQIGALHLPGEDAPFDELIHPECPIPPASTVIHGLKDEHVKDAPRYRDLADRLDEFCAGRVILGHNIGFDIAVLAAENDRIDRIWAKPRTLDTVLLARTAFLDLVDHSIESIASRLVVSITKRHTALGDAITTAEIFKALLPILNARGIRTLGEAERASQAVAQNMIARSEPGHYPQDTSRTSSSPINPAAAQIDSFPYCHRVSDVMSTKPLVVDAAVPIAKAARNLTERKTSSAFITGIPGSSDTGIVTERDLMRALASSPDTGVSPVHSIASRPLICVRDTAFVYRAIALMDRHRIRHLGVVDEVETLVGALTSGDLLRQRAQAALLMGDEIDHAGDARSLAKAWSELPTIVRSMLGEAVPTGQITAVIAEELAALTRRAGELAADQMRADGRGEPPAPYCLLILGSAGRSETRLAPDQDNALIYDCENDDEALDAWFAEYAEHLTRILDQSGVPYCKGGVMAKNTAWRHSLTGWKRTVSSWIDGFEAANLMNVDIFFDFRPVLGEYTLGQALWDHAYEQARGSRGFLKSLAALTTDVRSPIGMFGTLKTENGRVDCKKNGLFAIVGAARALAVRHNVPARSTTERLEGVRELNAANNNEIDDLIDAHEVLSREILRQQLDDVEAGIPTSTRVALSRLTRHERDELKWALSRVEIAQGMMGAPGGLG